MIAIDQVRRRGPSLLKLWGAVAADPLYFGDRYNRRKARQLKRLP